MGTGIVSVGLSADGQETPSRVLLAIAAARWLLIAALVPFGLGLYVFVISRFDFHQLVLGRGDHWITGGVVAISALAAGKIVAGANTLGILRGGAPEDIAIGLWVMTMLWLLVLLFAEARWPRLRYDSRRWSTVFPLGMYAASSFAVGGAAHASAITSFARVWVWIGLALWAIISVATIGRAVGVVRGRGSPNAGTPAPTT